MLWLLNRAWIGLKALHTRYYSLAPSKSAGRLFRQALNASIASASSNSCASIKPSLRTLLLWSDLQSHPSARIQLKATSIPSPLKPNCIIDVSLFHIILSFSSSLINWSVSNRRDQAQNLSVLASRILNQPAALSVNTPTVSQISEIASHYSFSISENDKSLVQQALLCASQQKPYNVAQIPHWINSVLASSVTGSCEALAGLTNIPPCVVGDVLFRSPTSAAEFYLMRDLWLETLPLLALAHINNVRDFETMLDNLIFYAIRYDPHALADLISTTFQYMQYPKKGFEIRAFDANYVNSRIWDISVTALLRSDATTGSIDLAIAAQEKLILCFSLEKTQSPRELLGLCAYLGIAALVYQSSPSKAVQLLDSAERRFLSGEKTLRKVDYLAYNVSKLITMATPQDLIRQFNKSATPHSNLPILWLAFIHKLKVFGLLNQDRSLGILSQVVKHQLTLLISKDIILALIRPIRGLKRLDDFIRTLGPKLTRSFAPLLIPKQIQLLYRHRGAQTIPRSPYPWDKQESGSKQFKGHASMVEYARFLSRSLSKKNTLNMGAILQGEAMVDPKGAFELYMREFGMGNRSRVPDERCLIALLRVAILDESLAHDGKVSPQIAVHEFKTSVKKTWSERTGLILPSQRLWQQYIYLLHKYEYIPELAILIEWWQNIHFVPDKTTLLMLLASLPPEYCDRYLLHYNLARPVKSVSDDSSDLQLNSTAWDWPDRAALEEFIARDARFQRRC